LKIITARWTPQVNILLIQCECGRKFKHPANRKIVKCECGKIENLFDIRGQMSKYQELRNQLTMAIVQCHEAKLGEAHDTDFYIDTILPIIAERCWLKDEERELPENPFQHLYENQAPNNIEIMLKVEKIKAYIEAQQKMLDSDYKPVIEIKRDAGKVEPLVSSKQKAREKCLGKLLD